MNVEKVLALREKYPKDTRVRLLEDMQDSYCDRNKKGLEGTVRNVDDMGTIHVSWDNGSTLGLIKEIDLFEIILPFEPDEDLEEYLDKNLEDMIDCYFDAWKDRYFRKSVEQVKSDFIISFDSISEPESVENGLKRELTDKEKDYVNKRFIEQAIKNFYQ